MKSENKLISALEMLNMLKANDHDVCIDEAYRLLHEVITDNQPEVKIGNIDIWKMVSNDELRPVMCGVCQDHENQKAVASDGHIMFVTSALYDSSKRMTAEEIAKAQEEINEEKDQNRKEYLEKWLGKKQQAPIFDKYGKRIDGLYPNWQAVIPADDCLEDLNIPYTETEVRQMLTEARAAYKVRKLRRSEAFDKAIMFHLPCPIEIDNGVSRKGEIGVRVSMFLQMIAFGLDGWKICKRDGKLVKRTEDSLMLVMPAYINNEDDYEYRREWKLTEYTSSLGVSHLNPDYSVTE